MFGGTKALSVSKITSSGMTLPWQKSPISKRGLDMVLSSKPGAVQSRFQQNFQSSVNLGQSSQDFKKSLNYRITWGKSPSPSLGAFKRQSQQGVTYNPSFLAIPQTSDTRGSDEPLRNLSEKKFKRPREVHHLSSRPAVMGLFPQHLSRIYSPKQITFQVERSLKISFITCWKLRSSSKIPSSLVGIHDR